MINTRQSSLEPSQKSPEEENATPPTIEIGDTSPNITVSPSNSLLNFFTPIHSPARVRKQLPSPGFFESISNTIADGVNIFGYFIQANVKHRQKITAYKDISEADMLDTHLDDIDDTQEFKIGFTRKLCLSMPTVYHASLAFQDKEGKFLIVGRQNAQFLKSNPQDSSPSFTWWALSQLSPNKLAKMIYNFTDTQMGNEKQYNFFPGPFSAQMSEVTLTGIEIKELIKLLDNEICSTRYDVIHSNCYSAVFYGLAKIIQQIATKNDQEHLDKKNNKALKSVFALIYLALQDNYHLGLGGLDNATVRNILIDVIKILEDKRLIETTNNDMCLQIKRTV